MPLSEMPTTIGPYRIQAVIAHGGMATVYHAIQPALARSVAIKVLLPALVDDARLRRQFQYEGQVLARLRHPHIVCIHDAGEVAGLPYLVLEYVPGPTLHRVLCARRRAGQLFTPHEALALLQPLAAALDYAHNQHVIHCDLKPENILLTDRGPVLTDFGLAQPVPADGGARRRVMGTPEYMAPEQLAARPVDRRTDVYGLGLLLYELLTGQLPCTSPRPLGVAAQRLQPVPALADRNPCLRTAPRLEAVVQRALAEHPPERWPSVGAMRAALTQAVQASAGDELARACAAPAGRHPARRAGLSSRDGSRGRRSFLVPRTALLVLVNLGGKAVRTLRRGGQLLPAPGALGGWPAPAGRSSHVQGSDRNGDPAAAQSVAADQGPRWRPLMTLIPTLVCVAVLTLCGVRLGAPRLWTAAGAQRLATAAMVVLVWMSAGALALQLGMVYRSRCVGPHPAAPHQRVQWKPLLAGAGTLIVGGMGAVAGLWRWGPAPWRLAGGAALATWLLVVLLGMSSGAISLALLQRVQCRASRPR